MMIDPPAQELINKAQNRYALVVALSKRSRQLINLNKKNEGAVAKKPLSQAIDELYYDEIAISVPMNLDMENF